MKTSVWLLILSLAGVAPLSAAAKPDPNATTTGNATPAGGKGGKGGATAPAAPAAAASKGLSASDIPPAPPHIRVEAIGGAAFGTAFLDQASKKVAADKFDTLRKAVTDANIANLTSLHSAIRTAMEAYLKLKTDNDGLTKDVDTEKARLDKYTKEAENPALKRNRTASAQAQEKVKSAKESYSRLEETKKKSDADLGTATDAFNAAKDAYTKALGTSQPAIDAFKSAAGF